MPDTEKPDTEKPLTLGSLAAQLHSVCGALDNRKPKRSPTRKEHEKQALELHAKLGARLRSMTTTTPPTA